MTDPPSQLSPNVTPPFLSAATIRRICLDALRSVNLLPIRAEPIRIDRFIEKKFAIVPQYKELPHDVLGYTEFADQIPTAVIVNRFLDRFDESVDARRFRTTCAHEAGHCLLHAELFGRKVSWPSLFPEEDGPRKPPFLCRHQNDRSPHKPERANTPFDRLEYQANQAIGALLLPRPLVEPTLGPFTKVNQLGTTMVDGSRIEDAVRMLSKVFDVNPVVARIWLKDNIGICS